MEKTVSAAEANRSFSSLLWGVRDGHSYVVTSHGKPVARLAALDGASDEAAERRRRQRAMRALLKRLEGQKTIDIGRVTREEMHER